MTISQEEYLKTIYILIARNCSARITDIANELNYTKASVNTAVKNLKSLGYLNYEAYGDITLTLEGNNEAKEIIKKHNTIKTFLINVLNVDKGVADVEAKLMQNDISKDTINKFELYIESIIDVKKLSCDYNPLNEKCQNCFNKKTKLKFDRKVSETKIRKLRKKGE